MVESISATSKTYRFLLDKGHDGSEVRHDGGALPFGLLRYHLLDRLQDHTHLEKRWRWQWNW
jgi:hypothetical protein